MNQYVRQYQTYANESILITVTVTTNESHRVTVSNKYNESNNLKVSIVANESVHINNITAVINEP